MKSTIRNIRIIKMTATLSTLLIGITLIFLGGCVRMEEETELAKPFGFGKGMTYEELKMIDPNIEHYQNDCWQLRTAPKPDSKFLFYYINVHETEGLYSISAIGNKIDISQYGTGLKSEYNEIVEDIKATYGEATDSYDFIGDWTTALEKEQRFSHSIWKGENPKLKGLEMIGVIPAALSRTISFIAVEYSFKRHERLREEGKQKPQF